MQSFRKRNVAIAYAGLGIIALLTVFPVIYNLLLALQTQKEASSIPPTLLPQSPQWSNFLKIGQLIPIWHYFANSLMFSASTTVAVILTSVFAAYATTKLPLPGRGIIIGLFMGGVLIPPTVRSIPLYTMISNMRWVDTWQGLSLPLMATGFGLFFMHQYMLSIPDSVIEAARMDGCSEPQIVGRIVAPLAVPGIITLTLYNFLFRWNEYLWPLIVTRQKWTTLPVGVAVFKTSEQLVSWNLIAAAAVVTLVPVLIMFVFFGGRIINGIALQASK